MSPLVNLDPALGSISASQTWDPPPVLEVSRRDYQETDDGDLRGVISGINYVQNGNPIVQEVEDTESNTGYALIINQTKVEGDIDYMSTDGYGQNYTLRYDKIRTTNEWNGDQTAKVVFITEDDLGEVSPGFGFAVGDFVTFQDGTPYGTVVEVDG